MTKFVFTEYREAPVSKRHLISCENGDSLDSRSDCKD